MFQVGLTLKVDRLLLDRGELKQGTTCSMNDVL